MDEQPIAVFERARLPGQWPAVLRLCEHEVEISYLRMGLLRSRESRQRMRYEQIAQVVVSRGGIVGYWELIIESTGGHTMRIYPLRQDVAQEARTAIEERMKLTRSMAAPSSAPSIATQIRELSELRDTGIITEAEFETKKKDLLDRM